MKLEQRYTAKQVVGIAIGSGCVAFLSITVDNLPLDQHVSHRAMIWCDVGVLVATVAAVCFMYYALAAFARGVEQEVWDKASLQPIKALADKPLWIAMTCVLPICLLGFVVFDLTTHWPRQHHMNAGAGYFWMSPFLALVQIRAALKPKAVTPSSSTWISEMKPIVSEHWGNRGPSHH